MPPTDACTHQAKKARVYVAKRDPDLSKEQRKRLTVQRWIQRNSRTKCRMLDEMSPHHQYIVQNLQWANKIYKYFGPKRQETCCAKHDTDKDDTDV